MMNAAAAALWLRAVHAVDARGLLPPSRSRLTPAELAAEAARRGEDRLQRLVDGWYYPTSYGRVDGTLSDEEADRLVAALETATNRAQIAPARVIPVPDNPRSARLASCELCGVPIPPDRDG